MEICRRICTRFKKYYNITDERIVDYFRLNTMIYRLSPNINLCNVDLHNRKVEQLEFEETSNYYIENKIFPEGIQPQPINRKKYILLQEIIDDETKSIIHKENEKITIR